jgi:uncharacterized protein (DUF697 family)
MDKGAMLMVEPVGCSIGFETAARGRRIDKMAEQATATGPGGPSGEASAIDAEDREALASKLVDRFAMWSGAAGLIPIPVVDIATVAGVQLQMLRRISQIYQIPFSENRGKSVIASLLGSMIPATSGMGIASTVKGIPGVGTTVAALMMPALSAGATYAIGRAFIKHFSSGGTLLDFNPPDYRDFIRTQREKWRGRSQAVPSAAASPGPAHNASSKGPATAVP